MSHEQEKEGCLGPVRVEKELERGMGLEGWSLGDRNKDSEWEEVCQFINLLQSDDRA